MKKLIAIIISLFPPLVFPVPAYAVCPVCTVAVGAGLGVSKALGIDDTVTSVWIGGLILSVSFWTIDWVNKKGFFKKVHPGTLAFLIILAWYLFTLVPLYFGKLIGIPLNTFWGADKIILGTTFGSAAFLIGVWADKYQRRKFGKQFFNFQKVIFPFSMLVITSSIFYFITN